MAVKRPARHTATIRDVAAKAGVSIATVSRVLNKSPLAARKSIEAVHAAIAELGFRPNAIGRQLKTAASLTIGVLVPSMANPVFAQSVHGIEVAAKAEGYSVLLTTSEYDSEGELAAIETLLSNRVEGLILTVADTDQSSSLDVLDSEGVPYVLIYNQPASPERSFISLDNVAAAKDLVEQLIGRGHRRIAMIAGSFLSSDRSRLRYHGYAEAMRTAGLPVDPVVEVSFTDIQIGSRLAPIFNEDEPPTALFCSTDIMGIAACRGLWELGISVPEDVSVVGFDGIDVGLWTRPTLATVVIPAQEMGAQAVKHLLDRIQGKSAPVHLTLQHRIRSGESWGLAKKPKTAPARRKGAGDGVRTI